MSRLTWKLGAALLLIVVVSVGVMAYLTNRSTDREFREYISHGSMMYTGYIENVLSQFYASEESWDDVQAVLNSFPRQMTERLIVAADSGVIVGDTAGDWLGRTAKDAGLSNGTPVIVAGREVGRFYWLSSGTMDSMMERMMGQRGPAMPMMDFTEQDFLNQVNRSLWLAGFIAAAVASLVGFLLTRQIIRPVRDLTRGARQIAVGDLDYRIKVSSHDEIGELAQSFNAMASSLDRSEQARQRLIADVIHELRTPLTIIEGTVAGILDGVFQPDNEHLNSIKGQTALLTRLIADLRDLSQAESGQLKLERTPTNIGELLRRKISQSEVIAREKNIRLGLETAPGLPDVNIDPTRIEQVIANLLSNAIDHTPAGGSVSLSVAPMAAGNNGVVILVADTGEGIAPEHLPHIFDRFYRVEGSRSRSEGGAGIGLAIVKQMVEAHGGKVRVESTPGKGSLFYVELPLDDMPER